jgi:hypothetical protein
LTNPDLHRCHLNASVALTALGVIASFVLNGLEDPLDQPSRTGCISAPEGRSRPPAQRDDSARVAELIKILGTRSLGLSHALDAEPTEAGKGPP